MKKFSLVVVFLLAGCTTFISDVSVLKQGIIEYQGTHSINDEHVAGYTISTESYEFVQETDIIPAVKGIAFALEYTTSFREGEEVMLREIVEYPVSGLTNPVTGKTSYSSYLEHKTFGSDSNMMFYQLSEDWEVVEGKWLFKVEANGREIFNRTFYIKKI